ncbi:putative DNA-binding WGR domain protein [Filimonas zeae]|uniref:WGR domain-containing protein n=1 Tax=Filimonas zeae TaxID=1737353 RepID=A0A917IYH9_9BACT|nr:WGR domain-containing protein [Filimonas zeae]MDR6339645.1 putative DNA-binding WGR domain protein [Filimonas zeae]GGH68949.1 hypothetical protein GCM10011379_25750 [Filimonas zeae]
MMQYFEFQDDNVSCFLEITLEDTVVRTRSGQKGTNGVAEERVFDNANTAAQEYERLVEEKKGDESYYFVLGEYRL